MKRFHFPFDKLLRVREFAENEAKAELGRQIGVLNELEFRLADNERRRGAAARDCFSKDHSILDIETYTFYLTRLDHEKAVLLRDIEAQNKKVDAARERYIEVSREKKVIDKLKEKRFKEYKRETQKAEEAEIDAVAGRK